MVEFERFASQINQGLNGFLFHDLSAELQIRTESQKNYYRPQAQKHNLYPLIIYHIELQMISNTQKSNNSITQLTIIQQPPNNSSSSLAPFHPAPMLLPEQDLINQQLHELENKILNKIDDIRHALHEQDKAIVEQIVMKKSHSTDPTYPKYDKKVCYYQEFWKVYLLNEIMITKIKDYSIQNKQLHQDINELDEAEKQWNQLWTQKSKKKIRRTSDMIQKTYQCPFDKCGRTYGSDVSLNLHMKIKHNSGTKTQRQALAKEICLAEEKGIKIKVDLNFPPGYLEEFRESFRKENTSPNSVKIQ